MKMGNGKKIYLCRNLSGLHLKLHQLTKEIKIMGKTVLPKTLIEEIISLQNQGFSSIEIFDSVQEEAQQYAESDKQLARCIEAIGRRSTLIIPDQKEIQKKKPGSIPLPKTFNIQQYKGLISSLKKESVLKKFEEGCSPIVMDILSNYEGFTDVIEVNRVSGFTNPPFDFFGYKKEEPYLIEFKGSLNHFHSPGETQKRRIQELLKKINRLRVALLQIRLEKGEYRIFLNEEMSLFFDGPQMPLAPVEKWIRQQLIK
jgi:hypothetical protein